MSITYARPSTRRSLLWTSRSIGTERETGWLDGSIGMSTSENVVTVCSLPSSKIWKSSFVRFLTKLPFASVTRTSISTTSTCSLNVGFWGSGAAPEGRACCPADAVGQQRAAVRTIERTRWRM